MMIKVLIQEKYVKHFHFICILKHSLKVYKYFLGIVRDFFTLSVIDRTNGPKKKKTQIDV